MIKKLDITHIVNGQEVIVNVSYRIRMEDNVQTISCIVNPDSYNVPTWLQMRNFELKSMLCDGEYDPLFTDNDNIKNIEAVLFIDKAYKDIMEAEQFVMALHA